MSLISLVIASLLYLLMIVMNILANSLPIGGTNTGEVSFSYPNLFQPAGFTFSIWGIIYLLLGAYLIYQFQLFFQSNISIHDQKINLLFSLSSVLNVLWLLSWHYHRIGLSSLIMLLLLITLGFIVLNYPDASMMTKLSFSVYFGWISVATIANITIFLVKLGIPSDHLVSVVITVFVLIVGLIIGLVMILIKRNIAFGLVFIWAYIGILSRHLSSSEFNHKYPWIAITSGFSILIFLSMSIFTLFKD